MRIALDTRLLHSRNLSVLSRFTREIVHLLPEKHPEHEFIYLSDSAFTNEICLPKNACVVIITPRPTNVFLHIWWYEVKLPLVLKKYKADVFLAATGICSLRLKLPQVLVVGDLPFLQKTPLHNTHASAVYKKYTGGSIKKAKRIVTFSRFVKEELEQFYDVDKEAIQPIGFGVDPTFNPVDWELREAIKEKISNGCEYFILPGTFLKGESLLTVLKAFSIFKKWQKTNMKLVIAGQLDAGFKKELEKLNSYKYRQDVYIKEGRAQMEMSEVVAAAYAMIFPSAYEGFAVTVLEALKCEVPVITSPGSSMREIAGEGTLYADPALPDEIAGQMKKIYKDENLRSRLIVHGRAQSELFDWNKTAVLLWEVIEQVVSK